MDDNKKKRPRARRIPEEIRAEKNTDGTQNQLQRPDTVPEASAAQTENAATPAPAAKPVENVPAARVQPRPEVRPTQNAPRPARTLKGESAKNPAAAKRACGKIDGKHRRRRAFSRARKSA